MTARAQAEEHLRVIRSLMEKATIYRAISAEAAAVGGVLALATSFVHGNWISAGGMQSMGPKPTLFLIPWLVALVIAAAANLFFLYRHAKQRGDDFLSPGMRLALTAVAPSFLLAGSITVLAAWVIPISLPLVVPFWISLYGVGLLSTAHFAPRSLVWLGWAFLIGGVVSFLPIGGALAEVSNGPVRAEWRALHAAQACMAVTFGIFHLIYAACTWRRHSFAPAAAHEAL